MRDNCQNSGNGSPIIIGSSYLVEHGFQFEFTHAQPKKEDPKRKEKKIFKNVSEGLLHFYLRILLSSSGKMMIGLNRLASSKSIEQ